MGRNSQTIKSWMLISGPQEIQLGPGGVAGGRDPAKQAAPPSYDEVVQLAGGGDEPPQYQDVVPENGQ